MSGAYFLPASAYLTFLTGLINSYWPYKFDLNLFVNKMNKIFVNKMRKKKNSLYLLLLNIFTLSTIINTIISTSLTLDQ